MSDLTKALMGYEETPFGYVNPDAVSNNTANEPKKVCPYPLEKFTVDKDNGVVIIPTPNGNYYHDESLPIDFDGFIPETGLGKCTLRKDDGDTGFSLSTTVFLATAGLSKSFGYDEVPYVSSSGTVLTLEQWQQLLDTYAEQYAVAENNLLLSVATIGQIAEIYFTHQNYNLYRYFLFTLKKSSIDEKDIYPFEIFDLSSDAKIARLVVLYHRTGGDVNSTDFLDFVKYAFGLDNCYYSDAIVKAWLKKTDLQAENAKVKALHDAEKAKQERKERVDGIVNIANRFWLKNNDIELAYKIFKMVNNHFYKTCSERFTPAQRELLVGKKVYQIRELLKENGYS